MNLKQIISLKHMAYEYYTEKFKRNRLEEITIKQKKLNKQKRRHR